MLESVVNERNIHGHFLFLKSLIARKWQKVQIYIF